MRTWIVSASFLLVFMAGCSTKNESPELKALAVTTATFDAQVLKSPKPVLVDFTASWCGPCQLMAPTLVALSKEFQVRVVDYDANPELVEKYDIKSIPALLIFVNGEVVKRHVGVKSEGVLRQDLQRYGQPRVETPAASRSDTPAVPKKAAERKPLPVTSETFDTEVLKNSKPVLVDFTATWCGPCKMMTPRLESLAKDYEVRVVDVDEQPSIAERYGVTGIPRLLIFVDGQTVKSHVGVTPESVLRQELSELSKK